MIITAGARRAAFRTDEPTAAYRGLRTIRRVRAGAGGTAAGGGRVVVEVSRRFGGTAVRALLGAVFTPGGKDHLTSFEVPVGPALGTGAATTCVSELGGSLAPGLPEDFAPVVLDALAGGTPSARLPTGTVRIDRAGFDETDSCELAFRLAAALLRSVLAARLGGRDTSEAARAALRAW